MASEPEEATVSYKDRVEVLKKHCKDPFKLPYPELKKDQTPVTMPIKELVDKVCDGIKDEELTIDAVKEPLKKAIHHCIINNHPAKINRYPEEHVLIYIQDYLKFYVNE